MKNIFLIILLFGCGSVFATSFPKEEGKITHLQIHKNPTNTTNTGQRFIVNLDSSISSNECGRDSWTGTLDTEAGKAIYSTVLAAAMAEKRILINGTSSTTCLGEAMLIRNVLVVY